MELGRLRRASWPEIRDSRNLDLRESSVDGLDEGLGLAHHEGRSERLSEGLQCLNMMRTYELGLLFACSSW